MHNGAIPNFTRVKRKLSMLLDEKIFLGITGSTDSEYIFAVILQCMGVSISKCSVVVSITCDSLDDD